MKKDTLLEIILGTVGGLIFSIGMVMGLMAEWNMLVPGIVVGIIGFIILLCIIPIYRKSHPKKGHKPVDYGIVATWVIGVIGALVMGFGISRVLIESATKSDMIIDMIISIIGLLVCVLNYPIYAYIKNDK